MKVSRGARFVVATGGAMLVLSASAVAGGELDTTFSSGDPVHGDGKVLTDHGSTVQDRVQGLATAKDGTLAAAGFNGGDTAISVYKKSGALDSSFSGDGSLVDNIQAGQQDKVEAAAFQKDGKLVAGGSVEGNPSTDFMIARYNTNGTRDNSCSGDGVETTDFGGDSLDRVFDIALQKDGKIVASGYTTVGGDFDLAVARYNTDCSLDTSFSGDGLKTVDFGAEDIGGNPSVAVQKSDGKLVFVNQFDSAGAKDVAVTRLKPGGGFDSSFSGDGRRTYDLGGDDDGRGVDVHKKTGKIYIGGYTDSGGDGDMLVMRLNSGSALDGAFAGNGVKRIDLGDIEIGNDLVRMGKRPIVAGFTNDFPTSNFIATRLKDDGKFDRKFSGNGRVMSDFFGGDDVATGVAVQRLGGKDKRIVLGGRVDDPNGDEDFGLLGYTK